MAESTDKSSPPPSPRRLPGPQRTASQHTPLAPSRLRSSIARSPEDQISHSSAPPPNGAPRPSSSTSPNDRSFPAEEEPVGDNDSVVVPGDIVEPSQSEANERTRLLESYARASICGDTKCDHGTFSPRLRSYPNSISSEQGPVGRRTGGIDGNDGAADRERGFLGHSLVDSALGPSGNASENTKNATSWLALRHGGHM